jgi:hypothetical protein
MRIGGELNAKKEGNKLHQARKKGGKTKEWTNPSRKQRHGIDCSQKRNGKRRTEMNSLPMRYNTEAESA